jgi:hypothetical protein
MRAWPAKNAAKQVTSPTAKVAPAKTSDSLVHSERSTSAKVAARKAARWSGSAVVIVAGGPGPSAPGRAGQLTKAIHVLQLREA